MTEPADIAQITDLKSTHVLDTAPMMAMACALIVNSHLEPYYPRAFLAADGLLGDSMFFLLSGFGLQMSEADRPRPFIGYYYRRLLRLYPAVIICVLCDALIRHTLFQGFSAWHYIQLFIWPTGFNFIREIVVFYAAFYFLIRQNTPWIYLLSMGAMLAVYLSLNVPDARTIAPDAHLSMGVRNIYIHDAAYFEMMLLGGYLATQKKRLGHTGWIIHIGTLGLIFLYFGLKFVMVVLGRYSAFYGVLHLLVFFVCGGLLLSLTDRRVGHFYRSIKPLRLLISLIAGLTLEIYLVHLNFVDQPGLYQIRFPINIMVFTAISVGVAAILSRICRPIRAIFSGKSA